MSFKNYAKDHEREGVSDRGAHLRAVSVHLRRQGELLKMLLVAQAQQPGSFKPRDCLSSSQASTSSYFRASSKFSPEIRPPVVAFEYGVLQHSRFGDERPTGSAELAHPFHVSFSM